MIPSPLKKRNTTQSTIETNSNHTSEYPNTTSNNGLSERDTSLLGYNGDLNSDIELTEDSNQDVSSGISLNSPDNLPTQEELNEKSEAINTAISDLTEIIKSSKSIRGDTLVENNKDSTDVSNSLGVTPITTNTNDTVNSIDISSVFGWKDFKPTGLYGALYENLRPLAESIGLNLDELNKVADPEFSDEQKMDIMKKRVQFYNLIQAYVGYYKVGVYVNPQGAEQPYYDLQNHNIYLGPSDFFGSGNVVDGVGAMLHETLHVHLSKGVKSDFHTFVFDKQKPGFSMLFNIVEDIRINDIASNTLEYGSDYIKISYKDLYERQIKEAISSGATKEEYFSKNLEAAKMYKSVAVNSILHNYGILKIGDQSVNDIEYSVITRKLDDLKKEFPQDYVYLTKTLDKLLERNGKYSKIKYSVRENFEEFTKGVYDEIYLPYKNDFEDKANQEAAAQKAMQDLLGDLMDEMSGSTGENGNQQGQGNQGSSQGQGGKPSQSQGSGSSGSSDSQSSESQSGNSSGGSSSNKSNASNSSGKKDGSSSSSGESPEGDKKSKDSKTNGGGIGDQKDQQSQDKGGNGGNADKPDGSGKEKDKTNPNGSGGENGESKDKNNSPLKELKDKIKKELKDKIKELSDKGKDGESALDKIKSAAQKSKEINEGISKGRSLNEVMQDMDAEFNKDAYMRIRNSISYKISDFVVRFRKVLFEKKKNVTQRGLNSGTSINGRKLVKNVMESRFGARDGNDVLSGVFERRRAPGKIPNYFFGIAIDNSGSMDGTKMSEAIKTGVLLVEVLRALKIPFFLYSYNTNFSNIYDFNNGSLEQAKKVVNISANGGTDEVPVLNELEKKLNAIPVRPGDKDATNKIVFIITDGESGSETTMKINQMKKKGYVVYGIGIGDGVREEAIKDVYGDFGIYCPQVSELSKIISAKLGELYGVD